MTDHEIIEYHERTLTNSVLVPGAQALMIGLCVACLAGFFGLLALPWQDAAILALGAGLLAFALASIWAFTHWEPVKRIESRPSLSPEIRAVATEVHPRQDIRLIPVRGGQPPGGVAPEDLRFFIEEIFRPENGTGRRWTKRQWVDRITLPSGRLCDWEYYSQMVSLLEQAGFITDRSERSAGDLRGSAEEASRVFGLSLTRL